MRDFIAADEMYHHAVDFTSGRQQGGAGLLWAVRPGLCVREWTPDSPQLKRKSQACGRRPVTAAGLTRLLADEARDLQLLMLSSQVSVVHTDCMAWPEMVV